MSHNMFFVSVRLNKAHRDDFQLKREAAEFLSSGVARNRRLSIVITTFNQMRTMCTFSFGVLIELNFLGPASLTRINFHPSMGK